jgi:hypothetical protein
MLPMRYSTSPTTSDVETSPLSSGSSRNHAGFNAATLPSSICVSGLKRCSVRHPVRAALVRHGGIVDAAGSAARGCAPLNHDGRNAGTPNLAGPSRDRDDEVVESDVEGRRSMSTSRADAPASQACTRPTRHRETRRPTAAPGDGGPSVDHTRRQATSSPAFRRMSLWARSRSALMRIKPRASSWSYPPATSIDESSLS